MTVMETLHLIHDSRALQAFNVTASMSATIVQDGDALESESWFLQETEQVATFWKLLVEISSARSWSQIQFTTLQPSALAVVLSPDHGPNSFAQQALDQQRDTWLAVVKAERATASNSKQLPPNAKNALSSVLQEMAWNRLQIAREAMVEAMSAGFQATDANLQQQARCLFNGPAQTKFDLEDLFAHLASVARSTNLPVAMNKPL